jgi:hypothetical protein
LTIARDKGAKAGTNRPLDFLNTHADPHLANTAVFKNGLLLRLGWRAHHQH